MLDHLQRLRSALADRYAIDREIGAGGMATVYLAEDLKHRRTVAVKVLRPELAAIVGAERFLKEIEVTANLQHPHILQLYDSGEADSFLYYVMPYVEGVSLREQLHRDKQLSVDEAVDIAKGVAAALDYAHRKAVIHRDIKPENILIHDGQPVVADFGIALAVSTAGGTRITETGLSLGTPQYMSPEQATGEREVTATSDVYSLGAVVYEMLTGDPPHTGSTVQAIIAKVVSVEPTPIAEVRRMVPPHVDHAVQKALAKVPADRFSRATEFAEALSNPAFALPSSRTVATGVGGEGPWNRLSIGLAALAGAMAVAAAALLVWPLVKAEPVSTGRVFSSIWRTVPPYQLVRTGGPTHRVRIRLAPDGSRLVLVGGTRTDAKLFRRDLPDPEFVPIPGTQSAYSLFFHPDGEWVAFPAVTPGGDHELWKVRLPDGPADRIADLPSRSDLEGGTWGRNDTIIFGWHHGGLFRVPASGGEPDTLTTPEGDERHVWPHLLPGDRAVLFTMSHGNPNLSADQSIWVLDLESGETDSLVEGRDARYLAATGHLLYSRLDGVLAAVSFDPKRLTISGDPVPVLDAIEPNQMLGDFTVSNDGVLAHIPSGQSVLQRLVVVDRLGEAVPWTPQRGGFFWPRFSRDGERISVNAWWENAGQGQDIYVVERNGSPVQITFGHDIPPLAAWSAGDDTLAYFPWRNGRVILAAAGGGDVLDSAFAIVPGPLLDWSRDGRYMVFQGDGDIWYLAVDGDRVARPLPAPGNDTQAKISPNGRYLAYVSDQSGRPEVRVRPFPPERGSGTWVIPGGGAEPVWGPDGTELFYWNEDGFTVVPVRTEGVFEHDTPTNLFEGGMYDRAVWVGYDVHRDGDRFVMIQNPLSTDIAVVVNWFEQLRAALGS